MVKQFSKLFQRVWEENIILEEWKKNIIIALHKKWSNYDSNKYRAIYLSPIVYKMYTCVLERPLRKLVEEDVEEEQACFRLGQ